jgi:phosphoesterase RecJ-like protein
MEIVSALIEAGAEPQRICDNVYFNLPPAAMKLIGKVLNRIEFYHDNTVCLLTLTKEMLATTGARISDSDGLVDFTLYAKDVVAGALLKEVDENHTKVSLRSRDHVNVAALASSFGGGGHFNAAGCIVPYSLEKAKNKIVMLLIEAINDQTR